MGRWRRRLLHCGAVVGSLTFAAACGSTTANKEPTIVASTSVIGSIVRSIVGDAAVVTVVMPNGKDPHEFQPSARDVERLEHGAVVVMNGNGLEAGFVDALQSVDSDKVFSLADHVTLRGDDPHLWLDPLTVREAIPDLAVALGAALNRDFSVNANAFARKLETLNSTVAAKIDSLASCDLVTDHDALAYFAARYGCTIVGSVVPGLSTAGEATAQDVQNLKEAISRTGVKSIFVEPNSSGAVAKSLADSLGVDVIELSVERTPDVGGYEALLGNLADTVVEGLGGK